MRRLLLVVSLTAACSAPASPAVEDQALHGPHGLSVLTQNLYIGADLIPLLQATPQTLPTIVAATFDSIGPGGTNLPLRAAAIAHEIALRAPDLVGLEEVAIWRRLGAGITYDFLDLIIDALCNVEKVCYAPAVVQVNSDFSAPGLFATGLDQVELVDRDAILVRDGSPVEVESTDEGHFKTELSIPTQFGTLTLPRGWVAIEAALHGRRFRFLDTHLEAFNDQIRDAQALELLVGPTLVPRPIVAVGDFNFDPSTGDYALTRAFGLVDEWRRANPRDPGFTCCQAANLANEASLLDERIDYVLARGVVGRPQAALVGATEAERVGGLWPSDHAGVAATLGALLPGVAPERAEGDDE